MHACHKIATVYPQPSFLCKQECSALLNNYEYGYKAVATWFTRLSQHFPIIVRHNLYTHTYMYLYL